jgi:hypothetical protein
VKTHYRFKNVSGRVLALDLDYGRVELEPGADFDIPAGYALPTPGASPQMHRPSVVEMLCGGGLKPVEPLPTVVVNGKEQPLLYRAPAPSDSKNRSVQRVPAQSVTHVKSAAQLAAEEAQSQAAKVRTKAQQARAEQARAEASGE